MDISQNTYCRFCAQSNLDNFIDLKADEKNLEEIVNKLIRLNCFFNYKEDILPKTVCLLCVKLLNQAFDFVKNFDHAQIVLKDLIISQPIKNENDESDSDDVYRSSDDKYYEDEIKMEFDIIEENNALKSLTPKTEDLSGETKETRDFCNGIIIEKNNSLTSLVQGNEVLSLEPTETRNFCDGIIEENISLSSLVPRNEVVPVEPKETKDICDGIILENNSLRNLVPRNEVLSVEPKETRNFCGGIIIDSSMILFSNNSIRSLAPRNEVLSVEPKEMRDICDGNIIEESNSLKSLMPKHKDLSVESKETRDFCDPLYQSYYLSFRDYSWMCSYCGTQFPTIYDLQKHSIEYHKACNAYRCTECNVKKMQLDIFIRHARSHKEYLKTSCYKCLKVFSSTFITNYHKMEHITSDFKCNGCNTCFESLELLNIHTKTFYKKFRPEQKQQIPDDLICPICKKTYKSKQHLRKHLLIHTDRKRNHICDVCGKSFLENHSLVAHIKLHDDSRPFQCEICKLSFKMKDKLRKHVGTHDSEKPFSCEDCGKCFRLKKQLKSHSIIHTNLLPYVCSICNKGFRFRSVRNQHMRQHTGVKPYKCAICEREFSNWANYNKHMKCRHSMDLSKKKYTPNGPYPKDPATEEVIKPEIDNLMESKKKILQKKKSGRPKVKMAAQCQEIIKNVDSKQ